MSGASRVIVVDDEPDLRLLLEDYLGAHGLAVRTAGSGAELDALLRTEPAEVLILDVNMPGEDGFTIVERLRRAGSTVGIVMLTAAGAVENRLQGLGAGADDYLAKPFEPRELLLRVQTILRRIQAARTDDVIRFGPFTFNRHTAELRRQDDVIHLTTGEISLLQALAAKPGRSVSRAELGDKGVVAGSDRAVDVQMARLRRKIEDDPRQPRYILTMRGSGYVLRLGS